MTGTLSNEGDFIAVTGGKATASINNVPIQAGKIRVVTVQGYDANKNLLPAFVGKGYYTSKAGQTTITITIDRQRLLTGQALEKLLQSDPGKASSIDIAALQAAIDEATGFNPTTQKFTTDPTLFDPQKLANLLANGGPPTKTQIQTTAQVDAGNVTLSVTTKGGGKFTEALSIEIDDPNSTANNIALNSTSPQNPSLPASPGGPWTLNIKKADGTVVGTTTVNVATNGAVTLGSASIEVALKPEIASLNPTSGSNLGGTAVTITGTGFTGATAVKFGNTNATHFTVNSNTQITATAPAGAAGVSNITVTTPGGVNTTGAATQFTYVEGPSITSLNPTSGTIGSSITINGTNFNATHGSNVVKFGTTTATTTAGNTTSLTVTVPAGISGTQDITVQDGVFSSTNTAADNFAVVPTVTNLSSTSGSIAGGGAITITGSGFATGATTVKFGTTDATNVNVVSNTSLTATIPARSAGQIDVTAITTAGGTSATSANSKYTYFAALSQQTSGTTASFLHDIVYANSKLVIAGSSGTVLTSPDGVTWTTQTSGTTKELRSITYGNSKFVAVGATGTVLTSADGITWSTQTSGTSALLFGVTHDGTKFVVVGSSGAVITSADGVTWTAQTSGTAENLLNVTYGNNKFVAVGQPGVVLTSPDGLTWTSRTSGVTTTLNEVTYADGKFVVVGDSGTVLTSADGVTWTARTSGTTRGLVSVAYANSKFVIVGDLGTLLTSPDGVNWTTEASGTTNFMYGVTHDGTKFVASGFQGFVATSNGL